MEKPLVVTLGGFDEGAVPRFTRGEGFTIMPRSGGRLEFRLTGAMAQLVREVQHDAGASPQTIIVGAILAGLAEKGDAS